jgi:hypothetical protein
MVFPRLQLVSCKNTHSLQQEETRGNTMQVAKYWRNNQLRYRLQGVIQQKIKHSSGVKSVAVFDNKLSKTQVASTKIKVA